MWKKMETAPTDGTPILVIGDCEGWRGKFSRVAAFYHYGRWVIYGPIHGEPSPDRVNCNDSIQGFSDIDAKLWQPLPDLPQNIEW